MNREVWYHIEEAGRNLRVEQFLRRKGYSAPILARLKQTVGSVTVNGSPCRLKQRLSEGDALRILIVEGLSDQKIVPVSLPLEIVYEDEDILVVNKPAGMPIHPSKIHDRHTLANAVMAYYEQKRAEEGPDCPFVFRCGNRLDRDTSGLTVVAKNMLASAVLSSMAVRHEMNREYLAIVRGSIWPRSGRIDIPLGRRPGPVIERIPDPENGEAAVTHYRLVEEKNGHSLVSLSLETGRTHQIRIHLKCIGYPIIGDYLYNPDMELIGRQALHSFHLAFRHPITGEQMEFTAPLPEDMHRVLEETKMRANPD